MGAHVVNERDVPEMEGTFERPGLAAGDGVVKSTRYLGLVGEDPVRPENPPYAYLIRRPKGDVTKDHKHSANRTEFVIEGEIEWREPGKEPVRYGAGTLTYVEAGTVYGYTVLEDAKILIVFESSPGMNYQ